MTRTITILTLAVFALSVSACKGEKKDDKTEKKDDKTEKKDDKTEKKDDKTEKKDDKTEKKDEPTAKKDEPTAKKDEPTAKKAEPTAKKDEPVAKKDEPTAKKDEPAKTDKKISERIIGAWSMDMVKFLAHMEKDERGKRALANPKFRATFVKSLSAMTITFEASQFLVDMPGEDKKTIKWTTTKETAEQLTVDTTEVKKDGTDGRKRPLILEFKDGVLYGYEPKEGDKKKDEMFLRRK